MSFKLKDLIVSENKGFSYSDFPYLMSQPWKHKLGEPAYDVKLGSLTIATVVGDEDGVWHVNDVYSRFKSKDGALRGILRRMNKK